VSFERAQKLIAIPIQAAAYTVAGPRIRVLRNVYAYVLFSHANFQEIPK